MASLLYTLFFSSNSLSKSLYFLTLSFCLYTLRRFYWGASFASSASFSNFFAASTSRRIFEFRMLKDVYRSVLFIRTVLVEQEKSRRPCEYSNISILSFVRCAWSNKGKSWVKCCESIEFKLQNFQTIKTKSHTQ